MHGQRNIKSEDLFYTAAEAQNHAHLHAVSSSQWSCFEMSLAK